MNIRAGVTGLAEPVQGTERPTGQGALDRGRLARGSVFNAIGLGIPLLVGLVCVPFIVRELGPIRFGLITLAWTMTGYFSLFDLGLGRAVTKLGAEAWADARPAQLRQLVATSQLIQLAAGALMATGLLVTAGGLARLVHMPAAMVVEATHALRVLALAIPAILLTTTYRGALEASQRFDLVNLVRAPLGASTYILTLVGSLVADTIVPIVWLIVGARLAGAIGYAWAYHQVVPRASARNAPASETRRLLRFGGWVTATSALIPMTTYIDRFLVAALISASAVAYYAGPAELATRLLILPGAVASALLPTVSQRMREEQHVRAIYARALRWCLLITAIPALVLCLAAEPVLRVWLGADYAATSLLVFRLLLIGAIASGLALVPFATLEGVGRPDLVTKYHLVELPIYAGLTVLALRSWGINGAALIWLLRNLWGLGVLAILVRYALPAASVDASRLAPATPHSTRR